MSNYIHVEDILDIHDINRLWYYIPNFNGYEISNDNFVRSMKHYKKYPFGILMQPKKDRKGRVTNPYDPIYTLSNNQNERVELPLSMIIKLARNNPYKVTGYPRTTNMTDIASRNQKCFILKNQITLPPPPIKPIEIDLDAIHEVNFGFKS